MIRGPENNLRPAIQACVGFVCRAGGLDLGTNEINEFQSSPTRTPAVREQFLQAGTTLQPRECLK